MPTVHLVCRPAEGGMRTHVAALLDELPRLGWTAKLHAPAELLDAIGRSHTGRLDIARSVSINDFVTSYRLAKQLTATSFAHAHGIRAAWICSLASLMVPFPFVTTLHNIPPKGLLSRFALKFIAKRTKRLICVSTEIASQVSHFPTDVIPNGIDTSAGIEQDRAAFRKSIGVAEDTFVVSCAARLSPEKGIDLLVEAAKSLPDIAVVIAGAGSEEAVLRASAPANVLFLGRIDNVLSLLHCSDCAVFPSRSEGQGIGILEAFFAETPVIATNVGGIPESIIDGVTGTLVAPDSFQAIATAIGKVRKNGAQHREMAATARSWVLKHRDRQTQTKQIAEIYSAVVQGNSVND